MIRDVMYLFLSRTACGSHCFEHVARLWLRTAFSASTGRYGAAPKNDTKYYTGIGSGRFHHLQKRYYTMQRSMYHLQKRYYSMQRSIYRVLKRYYTFIPFTCPIFSPPKAMPCQSFIYMVSSTLLHQLQKTNYSSSHC